MRRGLHRPVIFTMLMELVLRDLDDLVLAAICYAEDRVLAAASVAAAEVMVARVIAKLKEVGLTVGAEVLIHWTSHPKMVDASIVGWLCSVVGRSVGICVSGWECATCDCAQISSSEQMLGEMANRVEQRKIDIVAGFSVELELVDVGESSKREDLELECENGGKRDCVKRLLWMEMNQAHRWIEKCSKKLLTAVRERVLGWDGHVARMEHSEICAKALRCRGLQWRRWRHLQRKEVEKDKSAGPYPNRFKIYRWEDTVSAEVSKVCGNADGFTGNLHNNRQAQDRGQWRQFARRGKIKTSKFGGYEC